MYYNYNNNKVKSPQKATEWCNKTKKADIENSTLYTT